MNHNSNTPAYMKGSSVMMGKQKTQIMMESEEDRKRKRSGKPNTKKACYHCKKSHSCCSNEKPCPRCIQRGLICMTEEEYLQSQSQGMMDMKKKKKIKKEEINTLKLEQMQPNVLNLLDLVKQRVTSEQETLSRYPNQQTILNPREMIQNAQYQHQYMSSLIDTRPVTKIAKETDVLQHASLVKQQEMNTTIIKNLTDLMTQQKQIISHLLTQETKSTFDNPFVEYFLTPVPVSMWKFNGIGRPRELIACNDAFAHMLHCDSYRELIAESYQHEGIHIVLSNCNVDPTATPMPDLLTMSQGIAIILHGILKMMQEQQQLNILDRVLYVCNKSRLYGRVLYNKSIFKNGIIYASHHEINEWDDAFTINKKEFPATITEKEGYTAKDQEKVFEIYHRTLSNFHEYIQESLLTENNNESKPQS